MQAAGKHYFDGEPVKPFLAAIVLGADSVSPMTVTSAYGSLGHDGIHCTPTPASAITRGDGKPFAGADAREHRTARRSSTRQSPTG